MTCPISLEGEGRIRTLAGVVLDGNTALRELGDLGRGRDVGERDVLGESVADLELRHCECGWWGLVCVLV